MTFRDDNGNEIEVSGEIAMTKRSVSFFNSKIQGDVSTTFQIDNNSVNRKTLGYQGPQMLNQIAYTKQAFNRVRTGNILDRGYIVIQSDNGPTLSCFYVSGNSNWVQLLEGLITELDFTGKTNGRDYQVIWQQSNLSNTGSGIVFPLCDWSYDYYKGNNKYFMYTDGRLADNTEATRKTLIDFYPCYYLSSLVKEIISQAGLKYDGNLFNDALFNSLALTPDNGLIKRDPYKNIYLVGSNQSYGPLGTSKYTSFTEVSDPDELFTSNTFYPEISAKYYFTIYVIYASASSGTFYIYKNGVSVYSYTGASSGFSITTNLLGVYGDYFELFYTGGGVATDIRFNMKIETAEIVEVGDYLNPSDFLPSMKSMDVMKFCINYFGCSVYFNDVSKTVIITIVEKINISDSYDWSQYYVAHRSKYTIDRAANNYMTWTENRTDNDVQKYNDKHKLQFGDGNIQTTNTLKEEATIAKFPFIPFGADFDVFNVYKTNIPLINLVDDGLGGVAYTSIVSSATYGGTNASSYAVADTTVFTDRPNIYRVTNSGGDNIGIFYGVVVSGTLLDIFRAFDVTDTGSIFPQKVRYNKIGAGLVSVKNTSVSDFSNDSSIIVYDNSSNYEFTSINYGTFTKKKITKNIDIWKNNLAID